MEVHQEEPGLIIFEVCDLGFLVLEAEWTQKWKLPHLGPRCGRARFSMVTHTRCNLGICRYSDRGTRVPLAYTGVIL